MSYINYYFCTSCDLFLYCDYHYFVIGNVEDLGLTFATDEKTLDSVVTTELKYVRGTHTHKHAPIMITNENTFALFFSSMDSILGSPMTTNWNTFI